MGNHIFQSLWLGSRLSMMEVLSIESFLKFGYDYHLYCYDEVENVPAGVVVRDAREILPAEQIFYYQRGFGKGSPACFSDMFRYKLLLDKGQWWVDTDVVCVRPFEFASQYVIGEQREAVGTQVNGAVLKMPSASPLAQYCYDACLRVDRRKTRWGEIGPYLLHEAVERLDLKSHLQQPDAFYPIDYWRIEDFFQERELPATTYGVHLWHAVWKSRGIDPGGLFPPECLYERLRRQFLSNYKPFQITEQQCAQIIAQLARANTPQKHSRFKRARRWLRSQLPWRRAA